MFTEYDYIKHSLKRMFATKMTNDDNSSTLIQNDVSYDLTVPLT
jgi:hypothetical protein